MEERRNRKERKGKRENGIQTFKDSPGPFLLMISRKEVMKGRLREGEKEHYQRAGIGKRKRRRERVKKKEEKAIWILGNCSNQVETNTKPFLAFVIIMMITILIRVGQTEEEKEKERGRERKRERKEVECNKKQTPERYDGEGAASDRCRLKVIKSKHWVAD